MSIVHLLPLTTMSSLRRRERRRGSVASLEMADLQGATRSKVFGAYRVAKAAIVADSGSSNFVSGFLSRRPCASLVLQVDINAAVEALARGLGLGRAPIRINSVSPDVIGTPLHGEKGASDKRAMFEKAAARLPAGRVSQPENVAAAGQKSVQQRIGLHEGWRQAAPRLNIPFAPGAQMHN